IECCVEYLFDVGVPPTFTMTKIEIVGIYRVIAEGKSLCKLGLLIYYGIEVHYLSNIILMVHDSVRSQYD
ncbi:25675_t:CDS:2, partial [Racocetra persica]